MRHVGPESIPKLLLLLLAVIALPACRGVDARHIADTNIVVAKKHAACVTLQVRGVPGDALDIVEAPVEDYEEALRSAIERSQVFSGICARDQAGLVLSVLVDKGTWSASGQSGLKGSVQGSVPAQWRLTDPATRRVLYQEKLDRTGFNDRGVGGYTRGMAAIDMSIRASIVQGLQDISQLDLSSGK